MTLYTILSSGFGLFPLALCLQLTSKFHEDLGLWSVEKGGFFFVLWTTSVSIWQNDLDYLDQTASDELYSIFLHLRSDKKKKNLKVHQSLHFTMLSEKLEGKQAHSIIHHPPCFIDMGCFSIQRLFKRSIPVSFQL